MNIIKKQIAYNRTKRTLGPQYIVIHDTGNTKKGADAEAHFKYFNGADRQSSADFFVDSKGVLQVNDYNKYYTWHCGDGKGNYGVTNGNSLGVELCVNADGDYYKTFENAVELVKQLMKELNIPNHRVIRHYDASRKICPASMQYNKWENWNEFKEAIGKVEIKELDRVNDIVWELAHRGIITDKALWLRKLEQDKNSYWLARKVVQYLREKNV